MTMSRFVRRRTLLAIAVVATIAGAVGCGTSTTAHQTTSAATSVGTTTSAAAQGQSACADLNGTVGADQACHVHAATSTYKLDMTLPLDYPDMQAVADFLKKDRDEFLDWVAEIGPSQPRGRPYLYDVTAKTFRSGTPESGTQSLVLHIDNDTGLAHEGHPDTTFRAFNFDLGKRAPITLDTLFKPGTNPLEVLNPIVRRELHAPTADLDEKKYQNFALTDDAVIFFFGQDQVVMDNAGPHKVTVPRTELASLLA
jgi:Protein of unknown function (DUF3298)